MKQWWHNLSQREQLILGVGGVIAALLLFYLIVWQPLLNSQQAAQTSLGNKKTLLAWMKSSQQQLQRLKQQQQPRKTLSINQLLSELEVGLKQAKLFAAVDDLQQKNNKSIKVLFKSVSFDRLISWMTSTEKQLAIHYQNIQIKRLEKVGVVSAEIIIQL